MAAQLQGIARLTKPQRKVAALGLRQSQLAELTGLPESSISRALRGVSFVAATQAKIAAAVGMSPKDLFGAYLHPSLRTAGDAEVEG